MNIYSFLNRKLSCLKINLNILTVVIKQAIKVIMQFYNIYYIYTRLLYPYILLLNLWNKQIKQKIFVTPKT